MLAVALLALAAFASAASAGTAPTVFIKDGKKGLRFEAPKTIADGEELAVVNLTNPHKVGPHTFSLVTKGSIPTHAAAAPALLHPASHLQSDRRLAWGQGQRPAEGKPGRGRARKAGARWAT